MATFTNWTDLYNQMLNDLVSGNITVTEAVIGDKKIVYRNPDEIRKQIEFVKNMASFETGAASPRTYAGQGGRG